MARILPNGTEVRIGALLVDLEEALIKDAALAAPSVEDEAELAAQRQTARNAYDAMLLRPMTSRDMAAGFTPTHWGSR